MTQSTETVSQRARNAAADTYVADHLKREETALTHLIRSGSLDRNSRVQAFARFERELSTNKDETIANLREALVKADRAINAAFFQADAENRGHDRRADQYDLIVREGRNAIRAALTSTKKEG